MEEMIEEKKFNSAIEAIAFAVRIAKMKPGDVFVNTNGDRCVFAGWGDEGAMRIMEFDYEDEVICSGEISPCYVDSFKD